MRFQEEVVLRSFVALGSATLNGWTVKDFDPKKRMRFPGHGNRIAYNNILFHANYL